MYIGMQSTEIVDNKKSKFKDKSQKKFYDLEIIWDEEEDNDDKIKNENTGLFEELFCQEIFN